jgi:pimeloyl-ACP methyl ester carboxylesterase
MASQAYAIEHPESRRERLTAMVLVATASSALGSDLTATMAHKVVGHPIADLALAGRRGNPFVRATVGAHPSVVHLDAVRETFLTTDPASRVEFMAAMGAMDFDAQLAAVDLPVTVVCGTRDQLTPPAHSRRLAEVLPDAQLQLLHGAGHMLPFEEPDRIAALIHASATLQARRTRDGSIVLD